MKITEKQFQRLWDIFVSNLQAINSGNSNSLYGWKNQKELYDEIIKQQSEEDLTIKDEKLGDKKKFREIQREDEKEKS